MRRLILMRHAKSAWDTDADSDHARPLNRRGKRAAPLVAAALAEAGWSPDFVLLSDAKRTRQTFKRMGRVWDPPPPAAARHTLYHAGLDALSWELRALCPEPHTVLALGHNPGWSEALFALSAAPQTLKTADAACLTSPAHTWAEALAGSFTLERLIRARALAPT